jgi:hypothetical protein
MGPSSASARTAPGVTLVCPSFDIHALHLLERTAPPLYSLAMGFANACSQRSMRSAAAAAP